MFVPIAEKHYQVEDFGNSMRLTIPSRKHMFGMLFIAVWLVFWAVAEFGVAGSVASIITQPSSQAYSLVYLLPWLTLWTLGGGLALFELLWQLAGREVLEVDAMSFRLRREIFGIGRTREYPAEVVKALRATEYNHSLWAQRGRRTDNGNFSGPLAFDYRSRTQRCGNGLDEADAKQIVAQLRERYPQYFVNAIVRQ